MKTHIIDDVETIESVIKACKVCFVGMSDSEGTPYVLPMNFGYKDGTLYLHSGQEGRSITILDNNPKICITFSTEMKLICQHPDVACSYRLQSCSVICEGKVEFEEDYDKKVEALNIIMAQYVNRKFTYSTPAINNVKVWTMKVDKFSGKEYGVRESGMLTEEL
ncbi:MAG: pyridoxamine 5'-phosphate oxidase family protein [Proteiniphilum sp.]|nr:pyridoxamine 5'-phosphate oxidase family protein [Proteiniphilum sp.]